MSEPWEVGRQRSCIVTTYGDVVAEPQSSTHLCVHCLIYPATIDEWCERCHPSTGTAYEWSHDRIQAVLREIRRCHDANTATT